MTSAGYGAGLLRGAVVLALLHGSAAIPVRAQTALPDTAAEPRAGPLPDAPTDRATHASAILARFGERLAADVEADAVGSLAAAVVVEDSVVWSAAFGTANTERGLPATPGTVYRTGSISKTVTAIVLMRLVERGVVALDDPVAVHVPELAGLANHPTTARPITFRDLASHTAGLDREPAASHAARGPARSWERKVLESIPLTAARTAPGAAYLYSNIGYGILGLALERAAGRPFERLVREHVFDPLGMGSSFFTVPPAHRARLAVGYVNLDDGTVDPRVPRAEHRGRGYKVPNEGVYSTAGDLARLVIGLSGALGDTLLSAESRTEMLRPPQPGGRAGYGIGLQLTRVAGALIAGHSGTVAGYTAYLAFDPESRIGVVLLRNYNQGATNLGAAAHELILELRDSRPASPLP